MVSSDEGHRDKWKFNYVFYFSAADDADNTDF